MDQELQTSVNEPVEISELSAFFDLLARFDFEDHKKEQSAQDHCDQGTAVKTISETNH